MKTILTAVCMGLLAAPLVAQDTTYFAVSIGGGTADPLVGSFAKGKFEIPAWKDAWRDPGGREAYTKGMQSLVSRFPKGVEFTGFTSEGDPVTTRVDSTAQGFVSYYESWYAIETSPAVREGGAVLFWTGNAKINALVQRQIELDPSAVTRLTDQAQVLWREAVEELPQDERPIGVQFGPIKAESVLGEEGVVAVTMPAVIQWSRENQDDRASVFLLYKAAEQKVVFGKFGHPEWHPNSVKVLTVIPLLYFQIEGDPTVYFLGDHQFAWEHIGYAIYRLRDGAVQAETP